MQYFWNKKESRNAANLAILRLSYISYGLGNQTRRERQLHLIP